MKQIVNFLKCLRWKSIKKQHPYNLVIKLMALSAGLMLGLQIGTIKRQFAKEQENLQNSVKKAVEESSNIFST